MATRSNSWIIHGNSRSKKYQITFLLSLKKGDPPANLRDADGFCYRLIR